MHSSQSCLMSQELPTFYKLFSLEPKDTFILPKRYGMHPNLKDPFTAFKLDAINCLPLTLHDG